MNGSEEYIPMVAFVVSCLLIKVLMKSRLAEIFLDIPNHRSWHKEPVPRIGGLAIWTAVVLSVALLYASGAAFAPIAWMILAGTLVTGISLMDDYRHISALVRLFVHFLAAAMLLSGGLELHEIKLPGFVITLNDITGAVVMLFFVVWMINLYNFMDGMDGLAGGMAVTGFFTLSVLGMLAGDREFSLFTMIIAAAAGGFLIFNFPPAKIFMGDIGATFLGLLSAGGILWGQQAGIFPLWVGILVFSPFIVDATVTLGKRIWCRERIWEAHKIHYYHRLIRWWGHRRAVMCEYLLMVACSVSAVFAVLSHIHARWLIVGFWTGLYTVLLIIIDLRERQKNSAVAD